MSKETYLTPKGLEKLKQELDVLKNIKRKEVADRIQQAKDFGDLSENAEYADAKDEQAFIEGRIIELEQLIRRAKIIKKDSQDTSVNVGDTIKIKDLATGQKIQYEIVGSQEADPLVGKISNESPIGKAFLGKKVGDEVEAKTPKGVVKYKILEIS